jgi:hypothetical protein
VDDNGVFKNLKISRSTRKLVKPVRVSSRRTRGRMNRAAEMRYIQVKNRAVALLQARAIDSKTFDQIRRTESCIRSWCIRDALDRACSEIAEQLPLPRDRRTVVLRKSDFRKVEVEIKRLFTRRRSSKRDSICHPRSKRMCSAPFITGFPLQNSFQTESRDRFGHRWFSR